MGRSSSSTDNAAARRTGVVLAAGLPFLCYLATLSAHGHWLDAGEFVAVATDLGISHPPGQPLGTLTMSLAMLVPFGPIALRVALVSAVFATLGLAFFHRAVDLTLRAGGVVWDTVAIPVAVGTTWVLGASYGYWFQAVRPEVYALESALLLFVLERLVTIEHDQPRGDARPLYQASLAFGLALSNHHFLAFLVLPVAMPTVARLYAQRSLRVLGLASLATLPGLFVYVYLLLRARSDAYVRLGEPHDLATLFWVVSGKAFQKNVGSGVPEPLGHRAIDVGVAILENVMPLVFLGALGGIYLLLRRGPTRRIGYVWTATLLSYALARVALGFVRGNPDALGYLVPAFAATCALAAVVPGLVLAVIGGSDPAKPKPLAVVLSVVIAGFGLHQFQRSTNPDVAGFDASLARFTATDAFDEELRRSLPPRAVLFAYDPQTVFRFYGGEAEDGVRPDVTVVPMPFLAYPGMIESLTRAAPELEGVLRSIVFDGDVSRAELETLAAIRPVLLEPDVRVPLSLYEALAPRGLHFEVLPGGTTVGDEREGRLTAKASFAHLERSIGPTRDDKTRERLLWLHYVNALYYGHVGDRTAAREEVASALALNPMSRELLGLASVLGAPGEGPIDVRPFMVTASPEPTN